MEQSAWLTTQTRALGPIAPSQFSAELDQVGCHELLHGDCALQHFYVNSFSSKLKFKPKLPILSDQVLNFALTKVNSDGSCR